MKTTRMLWAAFIALTAAMFTACGSDEPDIPQKVAYESVSVGYYINLSEDYYKFYDVKVIFTDGEGQLMTAPLTENQDFGYTIPVNSLPGNIRFAIQATAKNPLPSAEAGATYTFGNKTSVVIVGNKTDGSKETGNIDTQYFEYEVSAENVAKFVGQEPELLIGPYEYSTEEFRK